MKKLLLLFFIALLTFNIAIKQANAQTNTLELQSMSAEFEADNITAESLSIEEPTKLPGDKGYWWTNFKRNTNMFFTFNKAKKAEKELKIANTKLLEAKKIAEKKDNLKNEQYLEETLEKYKKRIANVTDRVKSIPEENKEKFKNVLNNIDRDYLKQQQILRTIEHKLPVSKKEWIERIRKDSTNKWYEANKESVKERLETAIEQNNTGSNFKQLRNIATLEEIEEILPIEATIEVKEARIRAEEKLKSKLDNINDEEKIKINKYIDNIKLKDVRKLELMNRLEDSEEMPTIIKNRIVEIKKTHLENIGANFNAMSKERKEKWLSTFEKYGSISRIKTLENLKYSPEYKERIQSLIKSQEILIKENIRKIPWKNIKELEKMEIRLNGKSTLTNEIRAAKIRITPKPQPSLRRQGTLEPIDPTPPPHQPSLRRQGTLEPIEPTPPQHQPSLRRQGTLK